LSEAELQSTLSPMNLGFYATLILEAAEKSLSEGKKLGSGAACGSAIDLRKHAVQELGAKAAADYGLA
jgi:hypothetical protein